MAAFNQKLASVLLAFSGTAAAQPVYFQTPDDKCRALIQTTEISKFPGNRGFIQDGDKTACEVKLFPDGRVASLTAARDLTDMKQARTFVKNIHAAKQAVRVSQAQAKLPPETAPDTTPSSQHVTTVNVGPGPQTPTPSYPHFYDSFRKIISTIPQQNFSKLGIAFTSNSTHGFEAGQGLNQTPLLLEIFYLSSPQGRQEFYKRQEQAAMEAHKALLQETPKQVPQSVRDNNSSGLDQPGSLREQYEHRKAEREERRAERQRREAPSAP